MIEHRGIETADEPWCAASHRSTVYLAGAIK
jgi:hypothetical protein